MDLEAFVAEAKRSTYARGEGGVLLDDKNTQFVFERGDLRYVDTFFGDFAFVGQEIVFQDGTVYCLYYAGGNIKFKSK